MNYNSYEEGGLTGNDFLFTEKTVRLGFIRKVYSILMCQLLVTFAFICLFLFEDNTKHYFRANPQFVWVALAISIVLLIALVCCPSVRRNHPTNIIMLGLFTLVESFLLGVISSAHDVDAVLMAVGICTVVTFALTMFAFQTKYDFTTMGGVLLCAVVILILFGILTIFIKGTVVRLIYASLGALIFSAYIVYDTQLMMGGDHKFSISPEEYVFAALNLYLDIVNLFLYILNIISAARQ